MLERRSCHIKKIGRHSTAIARQFVATDDEMEPYSGSADPLLEDEHEQVRGLVHKYANRVLCLLTAECAAYCRFCTRRRKVSDIEQGRMTEADVNAWADYIRQRPEVREVILSGGDPLVAPRPLLEYALRTLSRIASVKIIRIGTRVPVTDPDMIDQQLLELVSEVEQPLYIGIHFEHPDEITSETEAAVKSLRKAGAILYSQTVFLAGVNDDYDTLYRLFSRLIEIGVRPYYIYRCDPVQGVGRFRMDFERERSIMTELRKNLSGLACPTYVIDTPDGSGKVPVPLRFWECDVRVFSDFNGEEHTVT